ncbi:MAG: hypothetical protein ABJC12_04895 [Saprospiraceae bacterium]
MRVLTILLFIFLYSGIRSQVAVDPWISSQLGRVKWSQSYEGVLADYHSVLIILASDSVQIAGFLIHKGDKKSHRLLGDWKNKGVIDLQERDEYDRLTGYLKGTITKDQVKMEWMSPDQSRLFNIIAYPNTLIKIKNFKPNAEWIEIESSPPISISVQKMDYGIVSGIAHRNSVFTRFEGYCLDGTCSIWNTVLQNPDGAPIKVQMRQRDANNYKAVIDEKEYPATITSNIPLGIRLFDNSMGFLDFIYPKVESQIFDHWVSQWVDKTWNEGVAYLTSINQTSTADRLVHRSSGWIELLDAGENYLSGMATYINPGSTRREAFLFLKKEDVMVSTAELLNAESDFKKAEALALKLPDKSSDEEYKTWLHNAGYKYLIPTSKGIVMVTEFNMIYGDDIRLLPLEQSKGLIKKKYWRNFGWQ